MTMRLSPSPLWPSYRPRKARLRLWVAAERCGKDRQMDLAPSRYAAFFVCLVLSAAGAALIAIDQVRAGTLLVVIFGPLSLVGVYDLAQRRHAIQRNYPVIGHIRWMVEFVRPEIRQYLIEADTERAPFSRVQRSLVYQRAKNMSGERPFGT